LEPLAGDCVDTVLRRGGDDLVAALAQNGDGLRTDQAGAADDDDRHALYSIVLFLPGVFARQKHQASGTYRRRPDPSRAEPLYLHAAGAQAVAARLRDACLRWKSPSLSRRRYEKRMRSSSSPLTQQAVSTPRSPVPIERRRRRPPHGRRTG